MTPAELEYSDTPPLRIPPTSTASPQKEPRGPQHLQHHRRGGHWRPPTALPKPQSHIRWPIYSNNTYRKDKSVTPSIFLLSIRVPTLVEKLSKPHSLSAVSVHITTVCIDIAGCLRTCLHSLAGYAKGRKS